MRQPARYLFAWVLPGKEQGYKKIAMQHGTSPLRAGWERMPSQFCVPRRRYLSTFTFFALGSVGAALHMFRARTSVPAVQPVHSTLRRTAILNIAGLAAGPILPASALVGSTLSPEIEEVRDVSLATGIRSVNADLMRRHCWLVYGASSFKAVMPSSGNWSSLARSQLEVLQSLAGLAALGHVLGTLALLLCPFLLLLLLLCLLLHLNSFQVKKHLEDPSLTDIASADDFSLTSTERSLTAGSRQKPFAVVFSAEFRRRYEHSHLVAALDVILEYQRNRKTTYFTVLGTRAQTSMGTYRHDPRTRLIELLKRWLRTHAANPNITEDEARA
ncbi:hypothetical protein AK812_SmicGene27663 [Symbiodinium microadriaticum]|uniref:Uncharacterized protein n=1 Tax=Symbiodinium microadriaticum TaxID=2951 RepID=A0A1Q9D6B5_SYMMI|nr:hypothetical protein AK812_SmicGene27663 [Symbiodinium microadriaticum]